jgi:hypothetical protein
MAKCGPKWPWKLNPGYPGECPLTRISPERGHQAREYGLQTGSLAPTLLFFSIRTAVHPFLAAFRTGQYPWDHAFMFNFDFHPVKFTIETCQRCQCTLKTLGGA